MKRLGSFLAGAAVVITVGCGGSTKDSDSNNGSGASGGTAGRGGSGGSAFGTGGGGVDGSGGFSGRGGSLGEAGSGGTTPDGGFLPPDCNAPPDSYGCEGGDDSFYFDAGAGVCKPYGSFRCSYGKANRFESLASCLTTCPKARPDVSACDDVSECVIVDNGCCAACEPVPRDSLTVVNRVRMNDFKDPCPPIACGACPNEDELTTARQYFVPTCGHGTCGMFDIRSTAYTECTADSDCSLRDGAQCCEGCDGKGLVSLNNQPRPELCSAENVGCPPCVPIIPPEFAPRCQEGRCRVTRQPMP
jgi:hypothetical protein